jgi:glycosyltransferase involved in cell wall biosynthesis
MSRRLFFRSGLDCDHQQTNCDFELGMGNIAISLVFCTRNRARQLSDCLGRIANLHSSSAWELVIVDNGSSDETKEVLLEFSANVPFPVKVLYEPKPGKSRGLNKAIAASTGDIVAFIDDDCYVAPNHIDRVLEAFLDPKIGFAGGRVERWDPTDYPMTIRTSSELELYPPGNYIEGGLILGANMMFRRSVLNALGGFDTDLGPGTPFIAEDTDIQSRASFANWWGLYTPSVVVAHHHGRKANDASDVARRYSNGLGALKLKFLLMQHTRSQALKACYWYVLGILRRRFPAKGLLWELEGAARYLAIRLRRRTLALGRRRAPTTGSLSRRSSTTTGSKSAGDQQPGITKQAGQ